VAEFFFGTMNFFDARVQEIRDGKVQIDAGPLGNLTAGWSWCRFPIRRH
jgi:hypothetical protein